MTGGRSRTIQPRHRARDSYLLGFARNLDPLHDEWAVDRLAITLSGTWESLDSGARLCLQNISLPTTTWLANHSLSSSFEIKTRADAAATLKLVATVWNVQQERGNLRVRIICNPTRTLAHLCASAPVDSDLWSHLTGLSPEEFFARSPMIVDEQNDNWLTNPRELREQLSGSFFDVFLPLFLNQVWALVGQLFGAGGDIGSEGAEQIVSAIGGRFRFDWSNVRVPQVETYFERHHSGAKSATQRAAMKLLSVDHSNRITQHRGNLQFSQDQDTFSAALPLTLGRTLVVYAKTDQRIRFEVRKHGKGRYNAADIGRTGRLLPILLQEREWAILRVRWSEVGALFDDVDATSLAALTRFVATVASVCAEIGAPADIILERLIDQGSIPEIAGDEVRDFVIRKLCDRGVIVRHRVRGRDLNNSTRRYALHGEYHDLRQHILSAFNPIGGEA